MGDKKRSSGHDIAVRDISVGSRQSPGNIMVSRHLGSHFIHKPFGPACVYL